MTRWTCFLAILSLTGAACTDESATTSTVEPSTTTRPTVETTTTTAPPGCPDVFCVRYHIHPDAAWADRTPVTAGDFAFTYETIVDPDLSIYSREGYDRISGYQVEDDKTILFAFSEVYAPWQTLFRPVLPRHILEGEAFNTVWDEAITMGSGPFVFSEWTPDERIVLTRNPNYWQDAGGDVQSVDIVHVESRDALVEALDSQEIDMFYVEPDAELVEEVEGMGDVEWEAGLGATWEHFEFNFDDVRLQDLFVRQAIAQGIDREAIVEAVVRPIAPEAEPLGNTIWLNASANYEDHFNDRFPYDPAAAETLLVDNGCVRGEDGIYECGGRRLSFSWATTAGMPSRNQQFEMVQADLAEIGIEVTPNFGPNSQVFSQQFFYGGADQWQLFNFAFIGSHDPAGGNTLYYCEGDAPNGFGFLNNLGYCNEQVDAMIRQTESQIDPAERAATYNEADELWLSNIPLVPLYQKPTFFAWNPVIMGPQDNTTEIGPFWNIADWTGKENVAFGAADQVVTMNVLEPDGDRFVVGLVTSAILQGAYTITPDFEYEPQLVTSAETIIQAD
ncbi:MAG: peptide ABC transporter substrate-binding protein [Acidimicrobiia bacterium]